MELVLGTRLSYFCRVSATGGSLRLRAVLRNSLQRVPAQLFALPSGWSRQSGQAAGRAGGGGPAAASSSQHEQLRHQTRSLPALLSAAVFAQQLRE